MAFEPRAFQNIAVSPDGTLLATTIYEGGASDLWVGDIARGTLRRLTSEGGALEPVWSADGRTIYFGSTRSGELRTYRIAADGSNQLSPVSGLTQIAPASEGRGLLLAQRVNPSGDMDILRIRADGAAETFIATGAIEKEARLSPDGRWVAYTTKRSERLEIHLRDVAGTADRQVSRGGGGQPSWSSDGRHLYYVSSGRVLRVLVEDGRPGATDEAYASPSLLMARASPQGLIVLAALDEFRPLTTINVVVNWMAEVLPRLSR
jgi:Tol biopolymer transport system component